MKITYIFDEALSGFRRNPVASFSSIVSITVSLLLIGLFAIFSIKISNLIENVKHAVEFDIFLHDYVDSQMREAIREKISSFEEVDSVKFISKDDAAKIFKEEFGEDINTILDFNPLPASFKVTLKSYYNTPSIAEELNQKISSIDGVEKVVYRKDLLRFIDQRANVLSIAGILLGVFLAVSSLVLVSNTIRLSIYAKKKNIRTMELIGASRLYIRAPFLVGGILQGLLGGFLAAIFIYALEKFVTPDISQELKEFFKIPTEFYFVIIIMGIALGLIGSGIAIKRYIGESFSK